MNARKARYRERVSHPCVSERYPSEPPCWVNPDMHTLADLQTISRYVSEWCENCKHVQPYYLAYQEAAKKARLARYQMTRAIQKMLSEADD